MCKHLFTAISLPAVLIASTAHAQTVTEILQSEQDARLQRWSGVNAYVADQANDETPYTVTFVRRSLNPASGGSATLFIPDRSTFRAGSECSMRSEELEMFAAGSRLTGNVAAAEIRKGLEEAGLPPELLGATGSEAWNTMDPSVMMEGNAQFLEGAAAAQRELEKFDPAIAMQDSVIYTAAFRRNASLVGRTVVDGRRVWHLQATGLNRSQQSDGNVFKVDTVDLFLDVKQNVPVRTKLQGVLESGGQNEPMTVETIRSDYRNVPNSRMYEPYGQMVKVTGAQYSRTKLITRDIRVNPEAGQAFEEICGPDSPAAKRAEDAAMRE